MCFLTKAISGIMGLFHRQVFIYLHVFKQQKICFNYLHLFCQTWEDPGHKDSDTGCCGDNDPIDICDIGNKVVKAAEEAHIDPIVSSLS